MFDPVELELLDGCEPPCKSWKSNPGPLEEQKVLSAAGSPL